MSEEEKKDEKKKRTISRREFLKDAGLVAGGIGTAALLSACSPATSTVTTTMAGQTTTVTNTKTVTQTPAAVTSTVTTTQTGGTATKTVTTTAPGTTVTTTTGTAQVKESTTLIVNGKKRVLYNLEPCWTLIYVLKRELDLTGTKLMCDRGNCGYCTVIVDNRPVLACMTLAVECDGKSIQTIEGLANGAKLHAIQQAFIDEMGFQCGACTPGMIMSTKALLDKNPNPTKDDIVAGLSGNICICGNWDNIMLAVQAAAKKGGS